MKIAVSSYSFSRLINNGAMSQLDCIERAADMGFDAIEFVDIIPHDGSSQQTYAEKLRKKADECKIDVLTYTFGADFLTGSGGDVNAEIERVKKQIDLAVLLGAGGVRHDATNGFAKDKREYRGFDNALPHIADACRQVTEYAANLGVRTMVENHGFFCQDSKRVEKLVNTVAHPNFGWLVDIGNFLCADESPVTAVGRAAPYAFHVHAKDFHVKSGMHPSPGEGFFKSRAGNYLRGAIIGHGNVPVKQCISALMSAGYNGSVSIEYEGMEDPILGIRIGLDNLKRYIKQAEQEL
jgi:sugar phosphate isomerase/epimerase